MNSKPHCIRKLVIAAMALVSAQFARAQDLLIEGLTVETYYISNAADSADQNFGQLPFGATTYRLYLDLCDGCTYRGLYASTAHDLRIQSTANFWNAEFGDTYGSQLNQAFFELSPKSILDSYLTFGAASNTRRGIPKVSDIDGSIFTSLSPGQPLTNDTAALGFPLYERDGLTTQGQAGSGSSILGPDPAEVFGVSTQSNAFLVGEDALIQSSAVPGLAPDNVLLIAQFTTTGELSFCLNLLIIAPDGSQHRRVCEEGALGENEGLSAFLKYPPECGCTDPDYLEFNPLATCDDGSCQELIVFGCLDEAACNYDPEANYAVPELCCFIDSCQGLDPNLLCPTLSVSSRAVSTFRAGPNPVTDHCRLYGLESLGAMIDLQVHSIEGKVLIHQREVSTSGEVLLQMAHLRAGAYVIEAVGDKTKARLIVLKDQ